jgi:hypothetical protein
MSFRRILIIILGLNAVMLPAAAQNIYGGNPADEQMLEAGFSNPALNALVKDRLALAMTAHQTGVAGKFAAVRSGFITYNFPWIVRGLAVGGQFFHAGLYSQNDLRFSYGRRILANLALGGSFDIFSRSYDRSQFVMFDDRDPVFRDGTSKFGVSLGLGIHYKPSRNLYLGLTLEHLNQPNLALGSVPFRQPLLVSFGLKWHGRQVNGFSAVRPVRTDDAKNAAARTLQTTQAGVEIPFERAVVRAALDPATAQVEVEAPLIRSFFFNYRYGYPLSEINVASNGTHRFGFFVDLDRMPVLPPYPLMPSVPKMHAEVSALDAQPHGFVLVYASTDSVSKMRLFVHRSVESGIRPQNLTLLFPEDLGDLKASLQATKLKEINLLDVRDPTLRLQGLYSTRYRGSMEGIGLQLKDVNPPPKTEMLIFSGAERRAFALSNLITGDRLAVKTKIPLYAADRTPVSIDRISEMADMAEETQELLYPDRVVFHIVPVFRSFTGCRWWLEVRDSKETCVYAHTGSGLPPDSMDWDWREANGNIIAPGVYTYLLRTQDSQGLTDFSHRGGLKVTYQHRSVTIDITRTPHDADFKADKYIFVIGAHKAAPGPSLEPAQ